MRLPRLLHITTVPMSLVFLRGQVGFMRRHGLAVSVVSSPGTDLDAFGQAQEIPTYPVKMPRRITPFADARAVVRLLRVIRAVEPDIVHAHTPKGGLLGMIAARVAGVKVRVYHMRGLPMMTATGVKRRLLRATERVACRLANSVLCVSHSLREAAIAEGLCPPAKIKVLLGGSGNGVDATGRFDPAALGAGARSAARVRLGIPGDAVVIGFVGRLVRDKGIVELAAAWHRLRVEYPTAHLILVGPFEPQDPVPAHVEAGLRADAHVHLTGMDWNTPALYAAMDLVVLPTYREGFPNVPLEAAAMALPVVATRVAGCVDAVSHGETGLLVPPRDATALADALRSYLDDGETRHRHGAAGRSRVLREFRQEAIWEALFVEYERLLGLSVERPPAAESHSDNKGAHEATV